MIALIMHSKPVREARRESHPDEVNRLLRFLLRIVAATSGRNVGLVSSINQISRLQVHSLGDAFHFGRCSSAADCEVIASPWIPLAHTFTRRIGGEDELDTFSFEGVPYRLEGVAPSLVLDVQFVFAFQLGNRVLLEPG